MKSHLLLIDEKNIVAIMGLFSTVMVTLYIGMENRKHKASRTRNLKTAEIQAVAL